jgi:outer membrane protein assembly factor BamB
MVCCFRHVVLGGGAAYCCLPALLVLLVLLVVPASAEGNAGLLATHVWRPSLLWSTKPCTPPSAPFKQDQFATPLAVPCNGPDDPDGPICVVTLCACGTVTSTEVRSGRATWSTNLDSPLRASPVAVRRASIIVVTSLSGTVFGVQWANGGVKWRKDASRSWLFDATALSDGNGPLVAIGGRDRDVTVLDARTGSERCTVADSDGVWGPVLEIGGGSDGSEGPSLVFAKTASTTVNLAKIPSTCASPDVPIQNAAVVSAAWRTDVAPPGLKMKHRVHFWMFGGPIVATSPPGALPRIAIGANDGAVHYFDTTTGSRLWKFAVPGTGAISAPLVLSRRTNSRLLVGVTEKASVFGLELPPSGLDPGAQPTARWAFTLGGGGAEARGRIDASCEAEYAVLFFLVFKNTQSSVVALSSAGDAVPPQPYVIATFDRCDGRTFAIIGCGAAATADDWSVVVTCADGSVHAVSVRAPTSMRSPRLVRQSAATSRTQTTPHNRLTVSAGRGAPPESAAEDRGWMTAPLMLLLLLVAFMLAMSRRRVTSRKG